MKNNLSPERYWKAMILCFYAVNKNTAVRKKKLNDEILEVENVIATVCKWRQD